MKNWNPTIEVSSHAGMRLVPLLTRHLTNRKVFLLGDINQESAMEIVSQLLYLQGESDEPIKLYINSYGGEIDAGLLIYDVLTSMTAPVDIYCMEIAASMAAILLAAGKKGHRFILPHSKVMIHEPLIQSGLGGSATSISKMSQNILETKKMMNEILAKCTGKTIEEIDEATSYDNYMNAQETIAFGICDSICESCF